MAVILKRSTKKEKGKYIQMGGGEVMICCPGCGKSAYLDHEISEGGKVSPSVVCPDNCGFHEYVELDAYVESV